MRTEQELRSSIMRRVYGLYFLRQLSGGPVKFGALLVLLLALRELTFVSKVIENAFSKHDALGFVNYMLYAFTSTEFIVQLVVVGVLGIVAFTAKDALSFVRRQQLAV